MAGSPTFDEVMSDDRFRQLDICRGLVEDVLG